MYKARFPDMCDKYGRPRWWRHYVYAMAWIGRYGVQEQLQLAQAYRMGQVGQDDFTAWQRDQLRITQPQQVTD